MIKQRHPRFLDTKIPWLPKNASDAEVRSAAVDLADAQLAPARGAFVAAGCVGSIDALK